MPTPWTAPQFASKFEETFSRASLYTQSKTRLALAFSALNQATHLSPEEKSDILNLCMNRFRGEVIMQLAEKIVDITDKAPSSIDKSVAFGLVCAIALDAEADALEQTNRLANNALTTALNLKDPNK
jgi:hypothetical protein